jgi:hypothetical protein
MPSEGLNFFFSWVRDWIMCKVRLKPQHSVITNLSVLAQDMKIGYLPNYEKEKATIYISYL